MNGDKILISCFIITAFFAASIFIAPFSLEKNTVKNLDGSAWRIDYGKKWDGMPLFPKMIYYFGDINCHQKYYRSYYINDNQMPVCARDTGMLVGLSFGFFISLFASRGKTVKSTAIKFFHGKVRETKKLAALFLLLFLPSAADGFLQLYSGYESINPLRTATGFLLGVGISFLVSIIFLTDPRIESS